MKFEKKLLSQYDPYKSARQVLTAIQKDNESRITHELESQGFAISIILIYASSITHRLWSSAQQNRPKNMFNVSIKHLNNTLATRKNLCKWSISQSSACSFCLQAWSLQRIVSSCKSHLEDGRYTWRHNSLLLYLAKNFPRFQTGLSMPIFHLFISKLNHRWLPQTRPCLDNQKLSSLHFGTYSRVRFRHANSNRKATKYKTLISDLSSTYSDINFVNLSMIALGILGSSSDSLLSTFNDFNIDQNHKNRVIKKVVSIAIR